MKAVVLVGGFGTRLRPLTNATPKQMLPLVDRPMIDYVVGGLKRGGVDEVVLSLGYKDDVFRAGFPTDTCCGLPLIYAAEPEPLDTAGAIRFAAAKAGIDQTFVVLNGDVLTDINIGALVDFHREVKAQATIALTEVVDPSRYGVVPTDERGQVLGFVEKPSLNEAPTKWINAGTYVIEPEVLEMIPEGRKVSIEREIFPTLVARKGLWAQKSNAYWIDVGTPATYLQAQLDIVSGKGLEGGDLDETLRVANSRNDKAGNSSSASVHSEAQISEAVVMVGARVERGAVVERSVIMNGAVVGEDARVLGSIVGPRAVVGAGAFVDGLSVVGDDVCVSAGAEVHGQTLAKGE